MRVCLFPICLAIFGCQNDGITTRMEAKQVSVSNPYNYLVGTWRPKSNICKIKLAIRDEAGKLNYIMQDSMTKSSGVATVKNGYINFGNISMLDNQSTLIFQNYGNVMNPFHHFKECDEKYLKFIQSKDND